MDVKISIVIPTYNVDSYVRQCLDSIISQSLNDYEVIMVDDGSTDKSAEILKEFATRDQRFKYIFQENSGPGVARNNGIKNSIGKYIVFMDPDDWYPSNTTLETLFLKIESSNCFVAGGSLSFYDEKLQQIVPNKLIDACFSKDEIIDFKDYQYYYFYTRFIYNTQFLKKNNILFPKNKRFQDVIFFLNVMEACKKFRSFPDETYVYRGNNRPSSFFNKEKVIDWMDGIKESLEISKRNHWAKIHYKSIMILTYDNFLEASDSLRKFFDSDYEKKYIEIIESSDSHLLSIVDYKIDKLFVTYGAFYKSYIWSILNYNEHDKNHRMEYVSKVINHIGKMTFIKVLIYNYLCDKDELFRLSSFLDHSRIYKKVKTIGMFNEALNVGGVERCISLFIPLFKRMGYDVVLFTETKPNQDKFHIDSNVKRIILPGFNKNQKTDWMNRVDILKDAIENNNIDLFYYHSYWKENIIFDELICKIVCNIPFILHHHNVFSAMLARNNDMFFNAIQLYSFSDLIISLSHVDQTYFRLNGIPSKYIPNPIGTYKKATYTKEHNSILWAGRFVPNHKQPIEALKILKEVKKQIPDIKLYMVGDGPDDIKYDLAEFVKYNDLKNNIEFTGFISDIDSYYKKCELMVLTSCIEGFPMVIAECKSYGLPIVAYDLPYVEMIRDPDSGVIRVDQCDYCSAADTIVKILRNPDLQLKLREDCFRSLENYSDSTLVNHWIDVFNYIENKSNSEEYLKIACSPNDFEILIKTYTYHSKLAKFNKSIVKKQYSKLPDNNLSLNSLGASKFVFSSIKKVFNTAKMLVGYRLPPESKPCAITKYDEMTYNGWSDIRTFTPVHIDIVSSGGEGMKIKYHLHRVLNSDSGMPFDEFGKYKLDVLIGAFYRGVDHIFNNVNIEVLDGGNIRVTDLDLDLFDLHNFHDKNQFEKERNAVVKKEKSKLDNIRDKLSIGTKILIVVCNRNDNKEIIDFGKKIRDLFPISTFTIAAISNYPELETSIVYRRLLESSRLHIYQFAMNDVAKSNESKWIGNDKSWETILNLFKFDSPSEND